MRITPAECIFIVDEAQRSRLLDSIVFLCKEHLERFVRMASVPRHKFASYCGRLPGTDLIIKSVVSAEIDDDEDARIENDKCAFSRVFPLRK